ncbi:AFG2-interacting ribosome maturation factor [Trichomycterus rosablanca]|uniref:AFG2-interacting ribosome maturation factor n=1 Tax=Trichomycterus rosablanca TaxID=2290929 RepID=UPI002F359A5E
MSQPALLLLQQELRKCFQSLETNRNTWRTVLEDCTLLMGSLGNLVEQMRALKNVALNNTPLSSFPQLQERLQLKLLHAIDTVLGQLSEKMYALCSVRDSLHKQLPAAFQLYEQNSFPIHLCVTRSALSPSIADMLEWLQDAERFYRLQYLQRKNLLETLKPDDLTLIETAPKRWASLDSPDGEERISDALSQVSFFLESD